MAERGARRLLRYWPLAALAFACTRAPVADANKLVVGDQRGGARALLEASSFLKDAPYRVK